MMWTLTLGLTLTPMKASPDGYAQGQPRASPPPAGIKDVTARRRGAPTSVSTKRLIARYGTPSYWPENLRIRRTIASAAFPGSKTDRIRPAPRHSIENRGRNTGGSLSSRHRPSSPHIALPFSSGVSSCSTTRRGAGMILSPSQLEAETSGPQHVDGSLDRYRPPG